MTEPTMMFPKQQILDALKANRAAHVKIVREAQDGFRLRAMNVLEQKLHMLRNGNPVDPNVDLPVPANYTDDFDRQIEMLTLSVGDTVALSAREFQCFVRNKWDWQRNFLVSNARYSHTAAMSMAADVGGV